MSSRLGIVGAVVLLLLGVVAMYCFRPEEPSVPPPVDGDRTAAIAERTTQEPPAAAKEQSSPVPEPVVAAPPEVIHADRGGYELVRIRGGTFLMGSPETEEHRTVHEGPQHEVTVPDFYIGRYEVTNEEYGRFLEANPDMAEPYWWGGIGSDQPEQPVLGVSWADAERYCAWAGLRLPSEAEWEYASRAGSAGARYGELAAIGWHLGNSKGTTHPVGEREPNAWGLYDVFGNSWEWCQDSWHGSYKGAPADCSAWEETGAPARRVIRGGCWHLGAASCRAAYRSSRPQDHRGVDLGFRPAMSASR